MGAVSVETEVCVGKDKGRGGGGGGRLELCKLVDNELLLRKGGDGKGNEGDAWFGDLCLFKNSLAIRSICCCHCLRCCGVVVAELNCGNKLSKFLDGDKSGDLSKNEPS